MYIDLSGIPDFADVVAPYDRWNGAMANVNASELGIGKCCTMTRSPLFFSSVGRAKSLE
jgi:hypothetical protein